MPLVPDPNCEGRGWVPVYAAGARDPEGGLVMTGTAACPRCGGSGLAAKPEVFPSARGVEVEAGVLPAYQGWDAQ